jgi:hypothetical protein
MSSRYAIELRSKLFVKYSEFDEAVTHDIGIRSYTALAFPKRVRNNFLPISFLQRHYP